MTQQHLIEQLAARTGSTKADAKKHLETLGVILTEALRQGERISLPGLGSFDVQETAARTERNPRTGESLQIAAKKKIRFKAGSELAGTVNR